MRVTTAALLAGCALGALVALSACNAAPTAANPGPATVGPTAATTPAASTPAPTTPAPTTAVPTTPPAPVTTGYDQARVQWQHGSTAISADEGNFWSAAANDLTAGESSDTDTTGYAGAVTALHELITLPDGQQTPAQNAAYHADINQLNTFFHTPGLYS